MSWFQLDAENTVARARANDLSPEVPCLGTSLGRGILGFAVVSIAGFAPWALAGRWFHQHAGEAGLYMVCALVFIGLSGPLLHRLILGPGSLLRFYKLFGASFAAYAALWMASWMTLRGNAGSFVGLFAGTAAMGLMFSRAFDTNEPKWKIIAVLFVLNAAGYFIGGWVEGAVMGMTQLSLFGTILAKPAQAMIAMFMWGVCYGIGFGAGLGFALHICQTQVRALLSNINREQGGISPEGK